MTPTISSTTFYGRRFIGRRVPWRRVLSLLSTLVVLAGAIAWAALLSPTFMGGPASYVLVSGESMEPALHGGDLVVTRERADYAVGDVVAYRVPKGEIGEGAIVIHRIVGGGPGGYLLRGDNRGQDDLWRPTRDDVVGSMWFSLSGAGLYVARISQPLPLACLMALIAFAALAAGGGGRPARS